MTHKVLGLILENVKWQSLERSLWIHHKAHACSVLLQGDFVEYGCGEGHSAALIRATMDGAGMKHKNLWCYDSFSGFPEPSEYDPKEMKAGMLAFPKTSLLTRFSELGLRHPKIVEGYFSETCRNNPEKIAFAHLDSDMYDSMLCSLRRSYDRLVQGGIILIDDYGSHRFPGVKTACDTFFQDKPEAVLVTCENQGMVQKQ